LNDLNYSSENCNIIKNKKKERELFYYFLTCSNYSLENGKFIQIIEKLTGNPVLIVLGIYLF